MTPINHIRLVQAAMLAAIVAVFVGPNPAFGKPMPRAVPDAFERYAAAHPYGQGIIDTSQAPDVFERYVTSHGSTSIGTRPVSFCVFGYSGLKAQSEANA